MAASDSKGDSGADVDGMGVGEAVASDDDEVDVVGLAGFTFDPLPDEHPATRAMVDRSAAAVVVARTAHPLTVDCSIHQRGGTHEQGYPTRQKQSKAGSHRDGSGTGLAT